MNLVKTAVAALALTLAGPVLAQQTTAPTPARQKAPPPRLPPKRCPISFWVTKTRRWSSMNMPASPAAIAPISMLKTGPS